MPWIELTPIKCFCTCNIFLQANGSLCVYAFAIWYLKTDAKKIYNSYFCFGHNIYTRQIHEKFLTKSLKLSCTVLQKYGKVVFIYSFSKKWKNLWKKLHKNCAKNCAKICVIFFSEFSSQFFHILHNFFTQFFREFL